MTEKRYVLDASVILAALSDETGADRVRPLPATSFVSAVNLSEIVAKLQERGLTDEEISDVLSELDLNVTAFEAAQAVRTGNESIYACSGFVAR